MIFLFPDVTVHDYADTVPGTISGLRPKKSQRSKHLQRKGSSEEFFYCKSSTLIRQLFFALIKNAMMC